VAEKLRTRIEFRVHPQAKRSRLAGTLGSAYKLDVAAPASDGEANQACLALLSELTGVKAANIRLAMGQTSRSKVFEFDGIGPDELRRRLDQAL
jgi:uncharacterized protein YggU (UPF0235/DUF167 family)